MYKANQEALFQSTNLGLVSLRQAEINYYFNVNSAIGTQAALIGGFTYGIFTQNPINTTPWASTVVIPYYCVTACTIASAVHVVINTMLIQVLGPGLALNGPVGSMARATDGMQIEQSHIIVAFGIMMSSFAMTTVLAFWFVFDIRSAIISTILFFFSAPVWYYYGRRIILRFDWDRSQRNAWIGTDGSHEDDDEPTLNGKVLPLQSLNKDKNPMHSPSSSGRMTSADCIAVDLESGEVVSAGNTPPTAKAAPKKGLFNMFGLIKFSEQELKRNEVIAKRYEAEELARKAAAAGVSREVAMEGYITKRGISRTELVKDPWERRYFVLNYRGQLSYYKSRQEYREDPKNRIKGRPIELEEYTVTVQNTLAMADTLTIHSGYTTSTATGAGLLFQMTLSPKEENLRQWVFKFDTEETLNMWVEKLRVVSPTSFEALA